MSQQKTAFDWNDGTPSIWSRDKELMKIAQGKTWGQTTQDKINLSEKRQVTVYSRARLEKKSD